MNTIERLKPSWRFALALTCAALAAAPAAAGGQRSYGYLRVLEGSATVQQAGGGDRAEAEVNQPVLAGDHLWVPARSRLEVLLADGTLLRIDGDSELVLERLAASADTDDSGTVVRLLEGNLQLVVDPETQADELPRIETVNATIDVENPGTFRVAAERDGLTEIVVRRGSTHVDSEAGSERVRAGEQLAIEGREYARDGVEEAGGFDSLERWARHLDEDYSGADERYADSGQSLRYAARPLDRYGSWINIDGGTYWRPNGLDASWRPYWQGRWAYTPSGLTWVSYEPWGWVPYHYGTWDYLPGYGWVWQAGSVFSPAWVYWYWGNDYAGWCPTGYYTRFYGRSIHAGFRFGVYGWASTDWGHFQHWNFIRHDHFGRRDQFRYAVPAGEMRGRDRSPGRGIITTDTRPLKPNLWRKPQEAVNVLSGWRAEGRPGRTAGGKGPQGALPDVTEFIARKPQLTPTEMRHVAAEGNPASLDGTPLKPSTLGRLGRRNPTETAGVEPRWRKPGGAGRDEMGGGTPGATDRGARGDRGDRNGRVETFRKPTTERNAGPSGSPGAGERRWSPGKEPGQPAERRIEPTPRDRRPRTVETESSEGGQVGNGRRAPDAPSWRKPRAERPASPPPAERDGGSSSWRSRERERQVSPPAERQSERPSWRDKPSSGGNGDSGGSSYRRPEPPPRATYERPAPPPRSERPSPPPSYRMPERSGGGSSGASAPPARGSSVSRPSPPPRENKKPSGERHGGDKGRERDGRPPRDAA
jgi:hypothetical protein